MGNAQWACIRICFRVHTPRDALFFNVWKQSLSFVCFETKVGSIDILLLLRTDMSEWSVWVTMPEVPPNTLQTALSRSARLYLSRPLHCISVCVSSVFLSMPLAYFHCSQTVLYCRQFAPCTFCCPTTYPRPLEFLWSFSLYST